MPARRSLLLALGAVAVGLASLSPVAAAPTPGAAAGPTASVELVSQTPVAVAGEAFVANVRLTGVPDGGSISLNLHQRMRSRSELAQSMEGSGLRCCVFRQVTPLSDLPVRPDGTRRVVLSLDAAAGGLTLPSEGVYPVELIAQDAAGGDLATIVTHLIVPPEPGDDAPDLAVAVVASLRAPVGLQPDGSVALARADVDDLAALVAGLAAAPTVPATLDVGPETVEALQRSPEPGDAELVDSLRATAMGRTVLSRPYVPLDLDALAEADLLAELGPQDARGRAVLADALGVTPDDRVQLAPSNLGEAGLAALAFTGATRLLLDDEQLEPLADGIIQYSLAQPFLVAVPDDAEGADRTPGPLQGLTADPVVVDRLASSGPPGLVVSRVLAELALIRLEQPSVARTAVVPLAPGLPTEVVQQLLSALGAGRPFEAVPLPEAFEHAAPVLDGGGNPAERALRSSGSNDLRADTARAIAEAREDVTTFGSLVGEGSALPDVPARHLLIAEAAGLDDSRRRAHLDAAADAIDAVAGQVSSPATFTLTLTAREGTIPLTVRNESGVPLRVRVHLRSQKLEFPDGDTIDLDLTEDSTRIDIRVRSLATGAFPLLIDVRTPDGKQSLSMSRYTVRSTAVTGVGLALSIGAGVFLVVWWARHWRRTRRSRRLIATNGHPSSVDP